jgi:hypothetical protein
MILTTLTKICHNKNWNGWELYVLYIFVNMNYSFENVALCFMLGKVVYPWPYPPIVLEMIKNKLGTLIKY